MSTGVSGWGRPPEAALADHLAQARLYGALLCLTAPPAAVDVRVVYVDENGLALRVFAEVESREALLLYYREGQSSKQVAMLLGLSDAAVRKRLQRARQSVRDDLLTRFSEFARSSAPSAAFAVGVTAALGITKPAAAAGLGIATKSIAGSLFARFALGFAGVAVSLNPGGASFSMPAL